MWERIIEEREVAAEEIERLVKSRNRWGQKYNALLEKHKRLRDRASACEEVVITQGGRLGLLQADNERLRAALEGLLQCPHIADRDIDPAWTEPETEDAIAIARAALAGKEGERL